MSSAHLNSAPIVHVYHRGWDCICEVEQHASGRFQAVIRCRSLMADRSIAQERDSQAHETAKQAIAHAVTMAVQWALKNRDHLKPVAQEKPSS